MTTVFMDCSISHLVSHVTVGKIAPLLVSTDSPVLGELVQLMLLSDLVHSNCLAQRSISKVIVCERMPILMYIVP